MISSIPADTKERFEKEFPQEVRTSIPILESYDEGNDVKCECKPWRLANRKGRNSFLPFVMKDMLFGHFRITLDKGNACFVFAVPLFHAFFLSQFVRFMLFPFTNGFKISPVGNSNS